MDCRYCQVDPTKSGRPLCLVPMLDGSCWSCRPCAIDNGIYCARHDQVHTAFVSGVQRGQTTSAPTYACIPCIEDAVRTNLECAEGYEKRIRAVLGQSELANLDEWLDVARSIMNDQTKSITLLRAVMTYAQRYRRPFSQVIVDVEELGTIAQLLPDAFV